MVRNIAVETLSETPLNRQKLELAERKCIGHPDSLADGIAEAVSQALSRAYLDECGAVLHHNTDQGEIVAGESLPRFGGGVVTRPMYVLLTGRATKTFDGVTVPTDAIALEAARNYLSETLEYLNMNKDVIVDCRMGAGSSDLRDVFRACEEKHLPHANDTSFGVGHAPFSDLETVILAVSEHLDGVYRPKNPIIGTDIKIMGLRQEEEMNLTLCVPMIDRFCADMNDYIEAVTKVGEEVHRVASGITDRKVTVDINTGDNYEKEDAIFLTVTGTSAEMGDDGSVGRGNRANGLITPHRPMSMEATSGKNPINHIGKIYNLLSTEMAQQCAQEIDGIEDLYIRLLSQIGRPIDQPLIAGAQFVAAKGADEAAISRGIEEIIDAGLENITSITERVIRGEMKTF
ncbi:methionine adenosyltransferase [Methanogenium organophilum]|uniref:Methionine adenosyltransferase n=1 Tax=Methanogenium organophilum TaxID=2199 RepID=A0A9X9S5H3_METOG|nr:methionine adenosyltransferase [Methanogenium organophilum]WAI01852.1 methionine adenosyltransferase [Methanogenium organophilum]